MGKGSQHDLVGLAMLVIAGVALVAACLGAFGSLGAWAPGYGVWQLVSLMASIVLAAALAFYNRRETTRLRRGTAEREGEVARLEDKVSDLRRANEALGRNEARYRGAIAGLPVAVFAVDGDGVFTLAEGKGLDALGLEPGAVVGRSIFDAYRDAPHLVENVRLALAGRTFDGILEVNRSVFEMRYSLLRENGEFSGVLGVAIDVTERKEAEEDLKESRRRLSSLLSNVSAYLYRCRNEPEWPNEFVSDYALELTGYTPEELTNGNVMFADLIAEEDRDKVWEDVQAGLTERRRFELRYSLRRKDGEERHVEERGRGVYGEGGVVEAIEGVVYDVTERVRTEEALREAEERYRTLVEQIPAVTYIDPVSDPDTSLYTSPQIERMLGYTPEEWIDGKLWPKRLHPEDRERVLAADERFEKGGGERFAEEYRLLAKDGSVVWVREEAVLVKDGQGEPLYWQGIFYDLTERREAEGALKASEERYRNQSRELALLHRVRTALAQELELRPVFRAVVEAIAETYGYTQVSAYLLEGEDLVLQHQVGYREVIERIPITEGVTGRAVRTGEPVLLEDVRTDPDFIGTVEGVTSEICVPLFDEGEAVGFLDVESKGGVKLGRKDLELMVTLGDHVGVAVGRARLHTQVRRSEERLRSLADAAFEGILVSDAGEILEANRALIDMFGYATAELVGRSALEFVAPEHRDLARNKVASGDEEPYEIVGVRKDDTRLDLEVRGRAFSHRGRDVRVTAVRDVTERKRAGEALREAEARYRTLVEHLPAVTFVDRAEGSEEPVYVSPQIEGMLGYTPEEWMAGRLWRERLHPDDRERVLASDGRFEADGEPVDQEYRLLAKDGSAVWIREETVLVRGEGGEPLYVQGILTDVTERKALEKQLQHQAMHDHLTGLPNRTLLTDRLRQALARAKRRGGEVAVLFVDLDNFKVVNDSLGHKAGDRLLVAASKRLRSVLRPEDTVARLGGDEFVLLLEDADAQEAVRVAERVIEWLREPLSLSGRRFVLTASIGVATGGATGKHAADLLRDADLAMYRGKRLGKARVAVFEEAMNTEAIKRLEMEHELRRAIERGELRVHYQPQMLLDANLQRSLRAAGSTAIVSPGSSREPRVAGVEALVRWEHPGRGLLLPGQFVPLAEETGLIVPMGEAVLEEACRQAEGWQRRFASDPPLAVCVNLSARQFREPDLPETVSRILRETDLDPTRLHLEITETTAMSDAPATVAMLEELKALGVRLVIDDFGTGYSSLSYLQRFPVDYVKIDRSFVADLEGDPGAVALVSGMIDLAHALGIKVIAEGVERAEQLERLEAVRCDLAQGYYFSSPLRTEAMDTFLEDSVTG